MSDTIPRKLIIELIEKHFGPEDTFSPEQVFNYVQAAIQTNMPTIENVKHRVRAHLYHLTQAGVLVRTGPAQYTLSEEYPHHKQEIITGTVYVLKDLQIGGYKIGISRTIKDRLRTLKVGTKCEVVGLWESPNYTDLERILHNTYKHCRIPQSEWFALSPDELEDICTWLDENASQQECTLKRKGRDWSGVAIIAAVIGYFITTTVLFGYLNHRIDMIQPQMIPIPQTQLVD